MNGAVPREIERVGIVGGGLMGTGIAETAARAGFPVWLFEPLEENRPGSGARLAASLGRAQRAGRLTVEEESAASERVRYVERLDELADCDLLVEAVLEDRDVKLEWFARMDAAARADALLASNTSSIPIAKLAAVVTEPARVLGMHFFSPAPVMRLVEIVKALGTSEETVDTANVFVLALGKQPIATKDRAGFIVNMLLVPYLVAGVRMLEEGFADRDAIGSGMKLGCGHPMGPLQLCDFIGLDVVYAVCDSLFDEFRRPEYAPPPLLKRMIETGWLGRKSGRGFYEYEDAQTTARGAGAGVRAAGAVGLA